MFTSGVGEGPENMRVQKPSSERPKCFINSFSVPISKSLGRVQVPVADLLFPDVYWHRTRTAQRAAVRQDFRRGVQCQPCLPTKGNADAQPLRINVVLKRMRLRPFEPIKKKHDC